MIKFISNIWDKYLKATGKRPYTEDELTEKLNSEINQFLGYYHLQHTRMGYEDACNNRDFIKQSYIAIFEKIPEGSRYPALKELLNFVKFVNALGFR